jgi:hypothetical protein
MLSVEGLDLHYGDAQALAGVGFEMARGLEREADIEPAAAFATASGPGCLLPT